MAKITNTKNEAANPGWLLGGNPGAIEAQEARGQIELVNSTQLPTDCRDRAVLEAAGVIFGEVSPQDPLFVEATLPEGWKKRPTTHSMWSELVDAEGKVRANIFYKAAFYDRKAHMDAVTDESGQSLVEYCLLLVFIALIVIAALAGTGSTVSNVFSNATTAFTETSH